MAGLDRVHAPVQRTAQGAKAESRQALLGANPHSSF